jgi:peptidyl-prolyl cis-trans isomerase D
MMQAFRNSAKPVIYIITIAFFAWLVIDLSGITNSSGGVFTRTAVGKVNGKGIEARTYESLVQQQIDQAQRQSDRRLTLEDIQEIRNQVWEQLVQDRVLNDEYDRNDITVSDDEVIQALRSSPPQELLREPIFQTDSQFDLAKYQRWLTSPASAQYVEVIAAQLREQIRRAKLFRTVAGDVYVSDPALWERYRDQMETVKIGLTAIIPRNAVPDSAVTVTPAEVAAYYKAHPKEFERSRTAYLSYVTMSRLPNAADTAAALERARAVRDEILKGAPFAEVAKRESADTVSGSKGGDLGEWTKGSFAAPFDSAAWKLPLNTLSEPVLTEFGYHLIEVTSRTGNKAKGRHILIPIELAGAHRDLIDARADSLERLAADKTDPAAFDSAARALHLIIGHTAPVQEGTRATVGSLAIPDAGVWAFEHKPGSTSPVIETPQADFVFRLDSIQPAGVPPLASIRGAVEHAVRQEKKWDKARELARTYLGRIAGGQPMAPVAAQMGFPYREFGPFPRISPPLTTPAIVGAAFGLDVGQRSGVIDTKDGLYVIEVLDRTKADSAAFVKDMDELRARAVKEERQERIRNYLSAIRASAKVVDRRETLYKAQAQAAQAGL